MESFLPLGGFQLPLQRRLSRLYNDTKKSSDFLKEPVQNAEDPELKALHRKLRIQKDRLVSWGLEWSDPGQSAEIDESLTQAGLSEVVGSIMSTIKDILAEAEPLWLASKRPLGGALGGDGSGKTTGDKKMPLVVWDKDRFDSLLRDLTDSIDTLYDLSRTRSATGLASQANRRRMLKSESSQTMRAFESTRMQAPQQIDPATLTSLRSMQSGGKIDSSVTQIASSREIVYMSKQAYLDLTIDAGSSRLPWAPMLLEYANFDAIYAATGITPPMQRFEKLAAGLQQDPQRSPGAWTGLPRLLGSFEDLEHARLGLVYQLPPSFHAVSADQQGNMCTLGDLLSRPDFEPRLEAKFRLAHNLANTVFDMHARGITHGNLLDSTISFCNGAAAGPGQAGEVDMRRPVLSSFDVFPDTPAENMLGVPVHLYRHPLDPRTTSSSPLSPKTDSRVLDLYSLAMMLLSIGLWTKIDLLASSPHSPSISESVLEQLAIRCGTLYMKAVQACWTAVDQELSGRLTGEELLSSVQVNASRYLEACCILDGVSGLDERVSSDIRAPAPSLSQASTSFGAGSSRMVSQAGSGLQDMVTKSMPPPLPAKIEKDLETRAEAQDVAPEPTEPVDAPRLRMYPQIPLPAETIDKWNTVIMPQINMALRSFYRKHAESVEISLESIGFSPQMTRPTVLVVCTSVGKVRAILKKKMGELFEGTSGLGLKVCRGRVMQSRKEAGSSQRSMARDDASDDETTAANPEFQERPNNGASIGAWIGDRHLPPVSFGGMVIIDDKPYGMTVHHMLDDPEAAQHQLSDNQRSAALPDNKRSMAGYEESVAESSSGTEDFACEFSDSDAYSETDVTSDDGFSDSDGEDDSEYNEPGDIPGVEPGCGDGYIVTQPALDDVEDGFYPSPETEDEDHLDTFSLGEIYASSGIRRRRKSGLVHEIDWALFEFNSDRQPDGNSIPKAGVQKKDSKSLQPTTVAPSSSLPGLEVQCIARTSGLQTGLIMPALTSVKIFGRASPSHTYQVSSAATTREGASGNSTPLGIPGDSGAWIVDRQQGRLCGHVLAWSQRKQVAYICPMEVLLLDIAETLEAAEVRLPGGEAFVHQINPFGDEKLAAIADIQVDSDDCLAELVEVGDEGFDEVPVLVETSGRVDEEKGGTILARPVGQDKVLADKLDQMKIGKGIGVHS